MVLPILVLAPAPATVPTDLITPARWARSGAGLSRRGVTGVARSVPVPTKSTMSERDKLIHRWRCVSSPPRRRWSIPRGQTPAARATPLPASLEAQELLRNCERLMRLLLRRARARLLHTHRRSITQAVRLFDLRSATITVTPAHADAAAWLLAAMHWWGCRHPVALDRKPLHPPTGLLRWLNGFELVQQVDRPHEVISMLPESMAIIERRSGELVAAMIRRKGAVALLPELLR